MALFSKKHYHALRDALRAGIHGRVQGSTIDVDNTISCIADMLARDNPAFERQRFITEIYVPDASHRSQES